MTDDSGPTYPIPSTEQRFVNVHGIRMAYRQAGSGPPVVLLHGLAASSLTWTANMEALAAHHTLYALDLPGHGDSDKPTIDYGIASGVKVFRRFLERIGEPRVALIGNSIGGLIALRFALEYPDQVTRLVLVDSVGLGKEVSWALRLAVVPLVGEVLLHKALVSVKGLGGRLFKAPQRIDPRLLRALHRARTVQLASPAMLAMASMAGGLWASRNIATCCRAWGS